MKENTQDKSLVQVNENSIFYKIKKFFRNLFYRPKIDINESINDIETATINNQESNKNAFMKEIRNIEDEETLILKLQKQYRSGEIKEEDVITVGDNRNDLEMLTRYDGYKILTSYPCLYGKGIKTTGEVHTLVKKMMR